VNEDLPEPPYGHARLPFGNAEQIEVENNLKDVATEKGEASVQKEVFWSKDLLFLQAQGVGSSMTIPIDVPRDGFYEVIAQIAQAPDYGDYVAMLDGKQTNSTMITWGPLVAQAPPVEVFHGYQPEIFVGVDHRLGWFKLSRGRHNLSFKCVGKDPLASGYNLGIDAVVLAAIENGEALVTSNGAGLPKFEVAEAGIPARPPATGITYRGEPLSFYVSHLNSSPSAMQADAIRMIGAFGPDAAPALHDLVKELADPDPEVRAAAAWALAQVGPGAAEAAFAVARLLSDENTQVRECAALALGSMGKGAAAAVPGLAAALKDPAPTVRMTVALALGRMGKDAKSAVPALVAALQVPNEEVQVLRNVAYALGDIGPDAASSIPALRRVQHLRVIYIAQEAIAKIEGKPSPTWH
jgi:hypothetical protein